MDPYEINKEAILEITQRLSALVDQAAADMSGNQAAFEQWARLCQCRAAAEGARRTDRRSGGHKVREKHVGQCVVGR